MSSSSSAAAAQDGHGGGVGGGSSGSGGGGGGGGLEGAVVGRSLPPLPFAPVPVETLAMLADRILVSGPLSTKAFIDDAFIDACSVGYDSVFHRPAFYRPTFYRPVILPTSASSASDVPTSSYRPMRTDQCFTDDFFSDMRLLADERFADG